MRTAEILVVLGGLTLLSCKGNTSGQTGSPDCALPIACPCEFFADRILVDGTVVSLEERVIDSPDGSYTEPFVSVEVRGVLNPSTAFDERDVGRRIEGSYFGQQHCNEQPPAAPAVGERVLASFWVNDYRLLACPDYETCYDDECGVLHNGEQRAELATCSNRCGAGCEPERSSNPVVLHTVFVRPWEEPIDLGGGFVHSLDEAAELSDLPTCFDQYPPPPTPPCDDTL